MAKAPAVDESGKIEVPLSEATHQQLIWFCKEHGYEWSEAETQSQTHARVKAAWEHTTIEVPAVIEEEAPKPKTQASLEREASRLRYGHPPTVKVKLLSLGDEPETEILLAHNGNAIRVQTGHIVELDWDVYQGCILDAQQIRYRTDSDLGLGEGQISQSIAFQRIE